MAEKNLQQLENTKNEFEAVQKTEKLNKDVQELLRAAKDQIEKLKKYDRMGVTSFITVTIYDFKGRRF